MSLSFKLFWKVFSALLFVVVSGIVLFFAYGYRYDFAEQEIQKTSIIDFQGKFADVNVVVDGGKVNSDMPYQFKGVLPGLHELEVNKAGFQSWGRRVDVEEDRVTIVEDVLLVPDDPSVFESDVFNLKEGDESYMGDGYLLVVHPGEKVMQAVKFGEEGKVEIEDIQLFKPIMGVKEMMPNQAFLLDFGDNLYAYVNLADQRFNVFYLPAAAYAPKVDRYESKVIFLVDDLLYRVGFDDLVTSDDALGDFESNLVASKVTDFAPDYFGNVYYVSEGVLFVASDNGSSVEVDMDGDIVDQVKNIAIREAGVDRTLIVRSLDDQRYLFVVSRRGNAKFLCEGLDGIPYYNGNRGSIAYKMNDGAVFNYDAAKILKEFIFQDRLSDFELAGWYAKGNYLLIRSADGQINVVDLFDKNRKVLLKNGSEFVQGQNYSLYYLEENALNVQYFEQVMRSAVKSS